MGPRPFGRGNISALVQGHRAAHTSMGPRPFGRGNIAMIVLRQSFLENFNGAAAFRSRKFGPFVLVSVLTDNFNGADGLSVAEIRAARQKDLEDQLLQWGRGLSVAEMAVWAVSGEHTEVTSMGPTAFRSRKFRGRPKKPPGNVRDFNGAAAFRSRKYHNEHLPEMCGHGTSMGPTAFRSRKSDKRPPGAGAERRNFNGAAAFRSRKFAWRAVAGHIPGHFNGAAAFRSRKCDSDSIASLSAQVLQWGRRPFGRGNFRYAPRRPLATGRLQWGRGLSVAEMTAGLKGKSGPWTTSMGPRPFGRGNEGSDNMPKRKGKTSMGPRPFGRGNNPPRPAGSRPRTHFNGAAGLSVAEIRGADGSQMRAANYFNGAAAFRSRKYGLSTRRIGNPERLQWGRRPFGRGNPAHGRDVAAYWPALQWGRGLSVAEMMR